MREFDGQQIPFRQLADAAIAAARRNHEAVPSLLSRQAMRDYLPGSWEWAWAHRLLAGAAAARGEDLLATKILDEATRQRSRFFGLMNAPTFAYLWVELRAQLADVHRAAGRTSEAEAIEQDLGTWLALADADDTLVSRLRRRLRAQAP